MIDPYKIVQTTADIFELSDDEERITHYVELQVDDDGVYIESTIKRDDTEYKPITEYISISNKELAIVIAKRILELYGEKLT